MRLWPQSKPRRLEALLQPVTTDLTRFARRLTRDPVQADDLLQDALVVALRKLDQLEDDGAFRSWMCRILYRTHLNRRGPRPEVWNVIWLDAERGRREGAGPEGVAADKRLGARIHAALDRLPAEQRDAVWLIDGMGLSFGEASDVLGVPRGTVASRVGRARAELRRRLQSDAVARGVIG